MKNHKIISAVLALCICLSASGCYDMTDIENLKNISVIFVENDRIVYCAVSTSPEEKNHGFEIFPVETNDVYEGLNTVSLKTGKKVSLSHLDAVMFAADCEYKIIKSAAESIVTGRESHPRVFAAVSKESCSDFFERLSIPPDTALYKKISDVLGDRFSSICECKMLDLYYAVNFHPEGVNIPVITLDDDGNIVAPQVAHINTHDMDIADELMTPALSAVCGNGGSVYMDVGGIPVSVEVRDFKIRYRCDDNKAFISAFAGFGCDGREISGALKENAERKLYRDLIEICNKKNTGFDFLGIGKTVMAAFKTSGEYNDFVNSFGGYWEMLSSIDFEIKIISDREVQ